MMKDNPTHLNCPWCPAQAFPEMGGFSSFSVNKTTHLIFSYRCPAKHQFYIEIEKVEEDNDQQHSYVNLHPEF